MTSLQKQKLILNAKKIFLHKHNIVKIYKSDCALIINNIKNGFIVEEYFYQTANQLICHMMYNNFIHTQNKQQILFNL